MALILVYIFLLCSLFSGCTHVSGTGVPKSEVVKCAVCRSLITELHHEIEKVDPRRKIEVGSYRIESDGNQRTTSRSYAGSESHMTEVLETVCKSFKDYAQAKHKETGRLEAIAIVGKDGQMNPRFGEYDMVQDPDLNKGLEFHCESIVEDFEDEIVAHFAGIREVEGMDESQQAFCVERTGVCKGVKEEL